MLLRQPEAILDARAGEKTQAALFADKEEIGSYGNTGMQSSYFRKVRHEDAGPAEPGHPAGLYETMENSEMLSGDVNSCLDPMFPEVTEKDNSALLGCGLALTKYTGARGKGGSNDANSEFIQKIRTIFNDAGVAWQIGELGKVDQGGGGTIAYMLADWGCEVVDCGTAMLSMHSPYDLPEQGRCLRDLPGVQGVLKASEVMPWQQHRQRSADEGKDLDFCPGPF